MIEEWRREEIYLKCNWNNTCIKHFSLPPTDALPD